MSIIVKAYCKKGKCKVSLRECQNFTYLVDKSGKGVGNYYSHETGITQFICEKRDKLRCRVSSCKKNCYITHIPPQARLSAKQRVEKGEEMKHLPCPYCERLLSSEEKRDQHYVKIHFGEREIKEMLKNKPSDRHKRRKGTE